MNNTISYALSKNESFVTACYLTHDSPMFSKRHTFFYFLKQHFLLFFITIIIALPLHAEASDYGNRWFASVYFGQFSDTALNEILRFSTAFENSNVYVLSLGKEFYNWDDTIGCEWEVQAAAHSGLQNHQEINGVFTLRWLPFPWDSTVDTGFAFGNGLSWASEDPVLEIREGDDQRTSQILYYILVELSAGTPRLPNWEAFVRIHHRSSVFGLIDNTFTGSNFVGGGLRYFF